MSRRRAANAVAESLARIDAASPDLDGIWITVRDRQSALTAAAANLSTKEELIAFLGRLRDDLDANASGWENPDLPRFLEALQAWLAGTDLKDEPRWRTLAKALLAGSAYE